MCKSGQRGKGIQPGWGVQMAPSLFLPESRQSGGERGQSGGPMLPAEKGELLHQKQLLSCRTPQGAQGADPAGRGCSSLVHPSPR